MAIIPTVSINRNGHMVIINQSDFDPGRDELWPIDAPSPEPNHALQKEIETSQTEKAEVTPTRGANPLLPIETRLAELQALATDGDWRALKAIAEGHGITRPNDGWDAAVLPILVAEYGQTAVNELEVEEV